MVLFGSLSRHAREISPLSRAALVVESGLVEHLDEGRGRNAQRLCDRDALRVHRRRHSADRIR